jgi:hypothetical protein
VTGCFVIPDNKSKQTKELKGVESIGSAAHEKEKTRAPQTSKSFVFSIRGIYRFLKLTQEESALTFRLDCLKKRASLLAVLKEQFSSFFTLKKTSKTSFILSLMLTVPLVTFAQEIPFSIPPTTPSPRDCRAILLTGQTSYYKPEENTMGFWESAQSNPLHFESSIANRIKHIVDSEPLLINLIQKRQNKAPLTKEDADLVVSLESDSFLNLIKKELESSVTFEKSILPNFPESLKQSTFQEMKRLRDFSYAFFKLRRELMFFFEPGKVTLLEAKLLLESWRNANALDAFKSDSILQALAGTHYLSFEKDTPTKGSSLGILDKALKSLKVDQGDSVLELQSGLGSTILGAAILYPELNFIAFERNFEKYNFTLHAANSYNLNNLKHFPKESIWWLHDSLENEKIFKTKVFYTLEKLSSFKIKSTIDDIKALCKKTGQKKYLILIGQEDLDAFGNVIEYSVIDIEP